MDAATWRRKLKARLRDVVEQPEFGGSQRKLAAAWLGDASKSPQVCAWCSDEMKVVPSAYSLHLLRERCGIDVNNLLSGPNAPPLLDERRDRWTPARRKRLSSEIAEYGHRVINERAKARFPQATGKETSQKIIPSMAATYRAVQGDFLGFYATELARLADRICDIEVPPPADGKTTVRVRHTLTRGAFVPVRQRERQKRR